MKLLELDAELRSRIEPALLTEAIEELEAPIVRLERGAWTPPRSLSRGRALGLLIVEGLIIRQVQVSSARCLELLGNGDLIRPWQEDAASFAEARWRIMTQTTIALLTEEFTLNACRYPPLVEGLVERAVRRSRSLAVHSAIDNVIGLQESLQLLFWHLAERWGTVDKDGVIVPLQLTHETLADLVGARRPSVTAALRELAEAGLVTRTSSASWRLTGTPPALAVPERRE